MQQTDYVAGGYPESLKYNYRFLRDCSNLMRKMNCTKRCRIPGDNIFSFPPSLTSPSVISTTCRTLHNNLHYTECSPSVNTLEHIHALIGYKLRPFSSLLKVLLIYIIYTVIIVYCLSHIVYIHTNVKYVGVCH